jgi:taurine transport system permease protein
MTLLHRVGQFPGLVAFLAPLALLVIVWAGIVAVLNVDTRVFPGVGDVFGAAVDSIRDGSLARHVGQSLLRVVVGTSLAIAAAIPLGVAMSVSPVVASLLAPLFRFFSVLAGIAWIPIATLWFGYTQCSKRAGAGRRA